MSKKFLSNSACPVYASQGPGCEGITFGCLELELRLTIFLKNRV